MSCACSCGWGESIGDRLSPVQTARKPGFTCPLCDRLVMPGQRCRDWAGLDADGGGWFRRFHAECFELMERYADRVCDGEWCLPFDLDVASEHAFAHSDEPFWREWLFLYETTWDVSGAEAPA